MTVASDPSVVRPYERRGLGAARIVDAIVGFSLAAAILVAPLLVWVHIDRTVQSARLDANAAAVIGAKQAGLDPTVYERVERIVPPHARYWIDASPLVGGAATRDAFMMWASGALLPRIAVSHPRRGDWIVLWGSSPSRRGLHVVGLHVLPIHARSRLPVYVGRLA
ncbi:MAG TPA: hypothetical protein VF101_14380 [Gaiellaceae bacterium]